MPPERFEDSIQIMEFPFRKIKTSDFFDENIRTFGAKHPYFVPKKSDVLLLPDHNLSLYKKSFWKSPTFPTPTGKTFSVFKGFRVKDRV